MQGPDAAMAGGATPTTVNDLPSRGIEKNRSTPAVLP